MDRKRLEATCTSLAVLLLGLLVFLSIFAVFDEILDWDILSRGWEKVAALIISTLGIMLGGCVLVSIMLNISIISEKLSRFVDELEDDHGPR